MPESQIPPALSPEEAEWLRQFDASIRRDFNALPLRLPPRVRDALVALLQLDDLARRFDGEHPDFASRIAAYLAPTADDGTTP